MLIGYFYESEAHVGHRLFAVGGYIALDDDWPVIERAWQDALRMAGITRFHMRDFAHFRGEFTGWSESQRRDLINAFAAIIRPDVLASVVGVIELEPYERFFRPALPPGHPYREPYLLCLQTCMERVNHWLGPHIPEDERFLFVCEERPKTATAATNHFHAVARHNSWGTRSAGIRFASKAACVPLQMADLIVYEANKATANMFAGFPNAERKSLTLLREACLSECGYFDADALEGFLAKLRTEGKVPPAPPMSSGCR